MKMVRFYLSVTKLKNVSTVMNCVTDINSIKACKMKIVIPTFISPKKNINSIAKDVF